MYVVRAFRLHHLPAVRQACERLYLVAASWHVANPELRQAPPQWGKRRLLTDKVSGVSLTAQFAHTAYIAP
jgi:hypothetical protein